MFHKCSSFGGTQNFLKSNRDSHKKMTTGAGGNFNCTVLRIVTDKSTTLHYFSEVLQFVCFFFNFVSNNKCVYLESGRAATGDSWGMRQRKHLVPKQKSDIWRHSHRWADTPDCRRQAWCDLLFRSQGTHRTFPLSLLSLRHTQRIKCISLSSPQYWKRKEHLCPAALHLQYSLKCYILCFLRWRAQTGGALW